MQNSESLYKIACVVVLDWHSQSAQDQHRNNYGCTEVYMNKINTYTVNFYGYDTSIH